MIMRTTNTILVMFITGCILVGYSFAEVNVVDGFWEKKNIKMIASSLMWTINTAEKQAIALLASDEKLKTHPVACGHAMRFLGRIRSIKGVDILAKRLLFETTLSYDAIVGPALMYPAYQPLVEIGHPSVKGLLSHIAGNQTTKKYRGVAMPAIVAIVGKDGFVETVTTFGAKQKIDADAQKRLKQLTSEFQKLYQ